MPATENRAFGKRILERCDCAAPERNGVERWDGKGECTRRDKVRYPTKRHGVAGAGRGENRDVENN